MSLKKKKELGTEEDKVVIWVSGTLWKSGGGILI